MSLYVDYLKEREGIETIESEDGFLTYTMTEEYLYIVDVYTRPSARNEGVLRGLERQAEKIAKEHGLRFLMGSVALNVNGVAASLKVLHNRGYSFQSFDDDKKMMYFLKEI